MVFAPEKPDKSSRADEATFLPFCLVNRVNAPISLETPNYSIDWAKEGVFEGVSSADFISVVDLGGRILVLLGDVEGKGCLVPREDQGEGLSSDQIATASNGATCATRYQALFSRVCEENATMILSSETPAVTAVKIFFEALEGKRVPKSLDFALIVLDKFDTDQNNPQLIAHICAAGVSVFLDADDQQRKIEPNATPFYPGIFGTENGTHLFENNKQHSIPLKSGERIVVASDGLERTKELPPYWENTETKTPIEKALEQMPRNTTADELLAAARGHAGCGLDDAGHPTQCHDDTTILVISVKTPPPLPSL
jgi:hypothetical protein